MYAADHLLCLAVAACFCKLTLLFELSIECDKEGPYESDHPNGIRSAI
jgi:hypothetical protein